MSEYHREGEGVVLEELSRLSTENVDPPDKKLGGLGSVFQLTRSQDQISRSPERSILSLDYTYVSHL